MAAMSIVTVIDAHRPLRRVSPPDLRPDQSLPLERAAGRDATGLLELALKEEFAQRTAVVSSFGSESAVLLHLVAQVEPATPILFLNTGKLFGETLRYRDRLQDELGLTDIRAIAPHPLARAQQDPDGILWSRDTDACCGFRKVEPLNRALAGFDAVITGRKQFQTAARNLMQPVEFFAGRYRFNPLWNWSRADLDGYSEQHRLPKHPLVEDGYASIGCIPCTRRLEAGEAYREGRWSGLAKDECGIHTGVDGEGI
jgi:phosphoadenosine phosphosulfate reductase